MIVAAMGAAAESRLSGASWQNVFSSDACLADRLDFNRAARLCGFQDDQLVDATNDVGSKVGELIAMTDVWGAVGAIATAMRGSLSGRKAALLAEPFLTGRAEELHLAMSA